MRFTNFYLKFRLKIGVSLIGGEQPTEFLIT